MAVTLNADTVVGTINPDDLWFDADLTHKFPLPGNKAAKSAVNTVTRKQARTIVKAVQLRANDENHYLTRTLGEVLDAEREERRLGNRPDWNLVEMYLADSRAESAHLPLTEAQQTVVFTQIAAINGVEPHWDENAQARIENLSAETKQTFLNLFMSVQTRGDLDYALKLWAGFIGNIAADRARAAKAAVNAATADAEINDLVNQTMTAEAGKAKPKGEESF